MELTCPHCGAKNSRGTKSARAVSCLSCGGSLGVREYDGYAVGRRVMRLAPVWFLLIIAGFVVVLLVFSWARRPVGDPSGSRGEDFRNEATNQTRSPAEDARAGAAEPKAKPATVKDSAPEAATPAATPGAATVGDEGLSEADSFSVQVGAFVDVSQANEQVSRLRAAGFEARVVEAGAATRFRFQVRSGRYATREEAARLAGLLRSQGAAGQTVIVEPEKK